MSASSALAARPLTGPALSEQSGPATRSSSAATEGQEPWDLCGLGRMPASGSTLPEPLGHDAVQTWMPGWKARLAGGDHTSQAAALLWAESPTGTGSDDVDVVRLIETARAARDPVVWSWAFGVCGVRPHDSGCATLHPADWARDDPGNALPWLLLGQADPPQRRQALARAAAAGRVQAYTGRFVDRVLREAPPDMPRYLRREPMRDAMGTEAMFAAAPLDYLSEYCHPKDADATERRSDCQALAEKLVGQSDTWRHVGLGIALGQRLGWAEARLAALESERQRGVASMGLSAFTRREQPYACSAMAVAERLVSDTAALGEVGVARAAVRR